MKNESDMCVFGIVNFNFLVGELSKTKQNCLNEFERQITYNGLRLKSCVMCIRVSIIFLSNKIK